MFENSSVSCLLCLPCVTLILFIMTKRQIECGENSGLVKSLSELNQKNDHGFEEEKFQFFVAPFISYLSMKVSSKDFAKITKMAFSDYNTCTISSSFIQLAKKHIADSDNKIDVSLFDKDDMVGIIQGSKIIRVKMSEVIPVGIVKNTKVKYCMENGLASLKGDDIIFHENTEETFLDWSFKIREFCNQLSEQEKKKFHSSVEQTIDKLEGWTLDKDFMLRCSYSTFLLFNTFRSNKKSTPSMSIKAHTESFIEFIVKCYDRSIEV